MEEGKVKEPDAFDVWWDPRDHPHHASLTDDHEAELGGYHNNIYEATRSLAKMAFEAGRKSVLADFEHVEKALDNCRQLVAAERETLKDAVPALAQGETG